MNLVDTYNRWKLGLPVSKPSTPRFRPLGRRNAVAKHLKSMRSLNRHVNPLNAARHDAVTGEPNLRTDEQATFDLGIRVAFQREVDILKGETARQIQAIDHRLKRLPPLATLDDALAIGMADEREESVLRSWRTPLKDSKRALLAAERGRTAFRRSNPEVLNRAVRCPNLVITLPGILAVASIEMLLNYQILLGSGGHRPAEIVTLVALASLFNLLFGLCAGFIGLRNLLNVRLKQKVVGTVALTLGFVLIVGLAFVLAHYRAAIDTVLDDPNAATNATLRLERMAAARAGMAQTMRTDPMSFLGHLNAVLIFLLGITFGTVAALEGYYLLDDPYPGLGAAERLYRHARDAHDREIKRFESEFASINKTVTAPLDAAVHREAQRLTSVKACLDAAGQTTEGYEKAATEVEHALFRMTLAYRDEYRIVRGNHGPVHWQEDMPRLDREVGFNLASFVAIEDKATADYRALEDQVFQIKSKLGQSQAKKISRMKKYLETIDQDALHEEDLALADLAGVRTPPPPYMN